VVECEPTTCGPVEELLDDTLAPSPDADGATEAVDPADAPTVVDPGTDLVPVGDDVPADDTPLIVPPVDDAAVPEPPARRRMTPQCPSRR